MALFDCVAGGGTNNNIAITFSGVNATAWTVFDMQSQLFSTQNLAAGQNIVVGDITYQTVRHSTNITDLMMSKSGTIYYCGENGIVSPTTMRYEANTALYTYNNRLGTFIFVPD